MNGVSVGTAKAEKEFPTVFVWKNVELNTGEENVVTVRAYFADGTCLEDNAVWVGRMMHNDKARHKRRPKGDLSVTKR